MSVVGPANNADAKVEFEVITELQRLRCVIDMITDMTNLARDGSHVVNAHVCHAVRCCHQCRHQ